MTSKNKTKKSTATVFVLWLVHPRLCPSVFHSWSPSRLPIRRKEQKWQGESERIFKKIKNKAPFGRVLNCPGEPKPWHLSEHAHYVTSCLWFGCWCQKWNFCWFSGGWGSRCNVRVLFVSSLFLLFLSFCTIIPFFYFVMFVFSSLSLWHLLFTVKMMMMMMTMCPSTCPPLPSPWVGSGSIDCANSPC